MIAAVSCFLSACVNPWPEGSSSRLVSMIQVKIGHGGSRFHGNYCGYGRTNGDFSAASVDRLDEACKLHDICYMTTSDHCKCNSDLQAAARAIVKDRTTPALIRKKAKFIQTSVSIGLCKIFPTGILPRT